MDGTSLEPAAFLGVIIGIAPAEVHQLKTAETSLFCKEWWPGQAEAGLFRALIAGTCNYLQDSVGCLNTAKYVHNGPIMGERTRVEVFWFARCLWD